MLLFSPVVKRGPVYDILSSIHVNREFQREVVVVVIVVGEI